MQTAFSLQQLADPAMKESEGILRTCVHCGLCTATCPTYLLLGDELDSPRGRIYLIKEMLESGKPASKEVVTHIDRCLSCLSCMSTCPSGVNYMHLVDHARSYIEDTYTRPLPDRMMRALLAHLLPYPKRLRAALRMACLAKPLRAVIRRMPVIGPRLAAMLALAPASLPASSPRSRRVIPAQGQRLKRVALLQGCAQSVLAPSINEAAISLLTRHGVEVVLAGEGCCGALVHHMGREAQGHALARHTIDAWMAEIEGEGLDAIVITASGCGTTIKDYGFLFRNDAAYADKAAQVSARARDITEFLASGLALKSVRPTGQVVAYHSACSMQHGQQIKLEPKKLLTQVGFVVKDIPEGHICCGSAGVYNMLQPEIAGQLAKRKAEAIARVSPEIIATGNLGCMTQIGTATDTPIVHTIQLLDWATGGVSMAPWKAGKP